ncbi:hypothetical protein AB1Y20_001661 [Prymnesium parvum]
MEVWAKLAQSTPFLKEDDVAVDLAAGEARLQVTVGPLFPTESVEEALDALQLDNVAVARNASLPLEDEQRGEGGAHLAEPLFVLVYIAATICFAATACWIALRMRRGRLGLRRPRHKRAAPKAEEHKRAALERKRAADNERAVEEERPRLNRMLGIPGQYVLAVERARLSRILGIPGQDELAVSKHSSPGSPPPPAIPIAVAHDAVRQRGLPHMKLVVVRRSGVPLEVSRRRLVVFAEGG